LIEIGKPFSNTISSSSGVSGVSSIGFVKSYASSGGVANGSSRIPHSLLRPHKFWSIEYGESKLIGIGMLCFLA